jgi:hypothetical protein
VKTTPSPTRRLIGVGPLVFTRFLPERVAIGSRPLRRASTPGSLMRHCEDCIGIGLARHRQAPAPAQPRRFRGATSPRSPERRQARQEFSPCPTDRSGHARSPVTTEGPLKWFGFSRRLVLNIVPCERLVRKLLRLALPFGRAAISTPIVVTPQSTSWLAICVPSPEAVPETTTSVGSVMLSCGFSLMDILPLLALLTLQADIGQGSICSNRSCCERQFPRHR